MVRHFAPDPVPLDTVERIVRLAQHAPSAGFTQGISFVLVTDAGTRRSVAEVAGEWWYVRVGHPPFLSEAPVHLVVCTSEEAYHSRYHESDKIKGGDVERDWPVPFWYTDAGCALMLLLLAAVDEGLAAAFVGVRELAPLRALLGIPESVTPIGIVLLGKPAPDRLTRSTQRRRKPLDTVLHYGQW